jgi:zinc transporter
MKEFAYVDDGTQVRTVSPAEAASANGSARLLWIHLNFEAPETRPFLLDKLGLDTIVVGALTASETRPRCEPMETGALVNLRGLSAQDEPEADPLVSIRLWIGRGVIVSLGRYMMRAMPPMCAAMKAGHVKDPGDFVAMLGDAITDELDPDVADLGDTLDDCELMLDPRQAFPPQRQALERLSNLDCDWLEPDDRAHLNESADRFARMAEELESIRERAALMHEQITDMRAEVIDQRSLVISIVALVFLPLTFLTGLFGMNVKLPFQDEPWAFWAMLGFCAFVVIAGVGYFIKARWFR